MLLERLRLFGYGAELPESVRAVLVAYEQAESLRRNRRDTAVLVTQAGVTPSPFVEQVAEYLLDDPIVAALAQARLSHGSQIQSVARLDTLRTIAMATRGWLPGWRRSASTLSSGTR